jgi:glycosyltransferase involved in cell wall biosynthesis
MKILSILIPNYNHSNYLPELIETILSSGKIAYIKIIVIDGGSKDGFYEKVSTCLKYIDIVISEPDLGQANAINKGLKYVDTKYWIWQNSDDLFFPKGLSRLVEVLSTSQNFDLLQCMTFLKNENGLNPIPLVFLPKFLSEYRPYCLNNQSLVFNSNLVTCFDENLYYAFDLKLFKDLLKCYHVKISFIQLGIYRSHDDTKTRKHINILRDEMKKIGHKYGVDKKALLLNILARLVDLVLLVFVSPKVFTLNAKALLQRKPW